MSESWIHSQIDFTQWLTVTDLLVLSFSLWLAQFSGARHHMNEGLKPITLFHFSSVSISQSSHSVTHPFTHSLTHSFTHYSLPHSLLLTDPCSLTHAHSLVPSDTDSFINSVFSWLCCGLLSGTIETFIIKLRLVLLPHNYYREVYWDRLGDLYMTCVPGWYPTPHPVTTDLPELIKRGRNCLSRVT